LIVKERRILAEDRLQTEEEVLDTSDGVKTFLSTKGPLRDEQGHLLGSFGIARDISTRKAAEAILLQQTAELAARNAELEHFNRATVGRELDMIALKQQVNTLAAQLGQKPPYALRFLDSTTEHKPDSTL